MRRRHIPIYEFKCKECDHQMEKLLKFSDALPKTCPNCEKEALEKLISTNTGFVLMGQGWDRPGMRAGSSKK